MIDLNSLPPIPKNCMIKIDATAFLADCYMYSLEEIGAMWTRMLIDAANKNWNAVTTLSFVIGYQKGSFQRTRIPLAIRRDVLAAGKCAFCGSIENLVVDHIKPWSKGGTHDRENLQCLCRKCNSEKSDKWEESHV